MGVLLPTVLHFGSSALLLTVQHLDGGALLLTVQHLDGGARLLECLAALLAVLSLALPVHLRVTGLRYSTQFSLFWPGAG
jgi:hypothetical protein